MNHHVFFFSNLSFIFLRIHWEANLKSSAKKYITKHTGNIMQVINEYKNCFVLVCKRFPDRFPHHYSLAYCFYFVKLYAFIVRRFSPITHEYLLGDVTESMLPR